MNSTSLSIMLAAFFLKPERQPGHPEQLIDKARQFLSRRQNQLGHFISSRCLTQRRLSDDLRVASYELCYERQSLVFKFAFFAPRGQWELQDLKWYAPQAA
jgi:hypothetical protein